MAGDAGTEAASAQELPGKSPGSAQGEPAEPVTLESVGALVDQKVELLRRSIQSGDDRTEYRLRTELREELGRFEAYAGLLKEAGLEVPADVKERALTMAQRKILTAPEKKETEAQEKARQAAERGGQASGRRTSTDGSTTPEDEAEQVQMQGIAQTVLAIQEEIGAYVEDKDPEVALIDMETESVMEFLDSVRTAATKKAERLGLIAEEEEEVQPGGPAARGAVTRRARRPGRAAGKITGMDGRKSVDLFREAFAKTNPKAGE